MNINIVTTLFSRKLYGFSGTIKDHHVWESGRMLMDRMWGEIRSRGFSNQGLNHWVYEGSDKLFVGVELNEDPATTLLESKVVTLPKYAYWKHVGAYSQLSSAYQTILSQIESQGLKKSAASIEIYGHDRGPGSAPEIEILIGLEE